MRIHATGRPGLDERAMYEPCFPWPCGSRRRVRSRKNGPSLPPRPGHRSRLGRDGLEGQRRDGADPPRARAEHRLAARTWVPSTSSTLRPGPDHLGGHRQVRDRHGAEDLERGAGQAARIQSPRPVQLTAQERAGRARVLAVRVPGAPRELAGPVAVPFRYVERGGGLGTRDPRTSARLPARGQAEADEDADAGGRAPGDPAAGEPDRRAARERVQAPRGREGPAGRAGRGDATTPRRPGPTSTRPWPAVTPRSARRCAR